jgi:outer membrane scaffolding protein for murein synthesis (MipA/OmpV family)
MKVMTAILLAGACTPCFAQSPTTLMPEGSRKVSLGAMFGSMPASEGSRERKRVLFPYLRVRWSNGVFVDNFSAGMQLSRVPHLRYGPLVALGDDEAREPGEPDGLKLLVGGFAEYALLHNLGVQASVLYGGARGGGRGTQLRMVARTGTRLAPHHGGSLEFGVEFADRGYMRSHFGETVDGGVKDTFVSASWHWQVSRKYELHTRARLTQLSGNVGASRFVAKRGGAEMLASLVYSF